MTKKNLSTKNISEFLVYQGIFFITFIVYIITIAPTLTSEDSGELIAAAHSLGIPHPPGYPFWTSIAKLFSLIPLGSIPFRCNLLSAFCAALAMAVIYRILFRLTGHRVISISCVLLFAFSPMMWSQAVITEVYSLHVLLYSIMLDRFLLWMGSQKKEDFILFVFFLGLSLSNHHLSLTIIPPALLVIFLLQPGVLKKKEVMAPAILFFLLGIVLYIYLPVRSINNPAMDWGNPENLSNFFDHVSRKQYGLSKTSKSFDPSALRARFEFVLLWLKEQFPIPLLLIGCMGVYFGFLKERMRCFFLVASYLMGSFVLALTLNFNIEYLQLMDVSVFFLTSYIPFILLIGIGFSGIYEHFKINQYVQKFKNVFFLLLPLCFLLPNFSRSNMSDNYFALDYATSILRETGRESILFSSGDNHLFPLYYAQMVERRRLDVTVCPSNKSLHDVLQYAGYNETGFLSISKQKGLILEFLEKGTPIYFPEKSNSYPGYRLIPTAFNFKAVPESSSFRFEDPSPFFMRPDEKPVSAWTPYTNVLDISAYHYFAASRWHAKGRKDLALKEIAIFVSLHGNTKVALRYAVLTLREWGYKTGSIK